MIFSSEKRPALIQQVREKKETVKVAQIAQALGKLWAGLSDDDKTPYEDMALRDKQRYAEEKSAKKDLKEDVDDGKSLRFSYMGQLKQHVARIGDKHKTRITTGLSVPLTVSMMAFLPIVLFAVVTARNRIT